MTKKKHYAYFETKETPLKDYWTRLRIVAHDKGLSQKALSKLEWIIFYFTVGKQDATATAKHFGISRKTFHKWLARFDEQNLLALEEHSRAPKNTRGWTVTFEQRHRIIYLRMLHLKWGKRKLKRLYLTTFQEDISTWKIESVVRKYGLYPLEVNRKRRKIKAKSKQKVLIKNFQKQDKFGFLWHIDAIIIWWYGARRVIFTALEDQTKIAFARVYTTNSSEFSKDFLERLIYLVNGQVNFIHSDNGSEFQGKFEQACTLLSINQIYSRPHTPKDNPALERFNWTVQDEWLSMSEVGLDTIQQANTDLTNWLIEYNAVRPHDSLDLQTPLEYADSTYFQEVLPMWSAGTDC